MGDVPGGGLRDDARFQRGPRPHDEDRQTFWEGDLELDLVAPDPEDARRLLVAEVKWKRLSAAERKRALRELEGKWSRCSLRAEYPAVRFEVLDAGLLAG